MKQSALIFILGLLFSIASIQATPTSQITRSDNGSINELSSSNSSLGTSFSVNSPVSFLQNNKRSNFGL